MATKLKVIQKKAAPAPNNPGVDELQNAYNLLAAEKQKRENAAGAAWPEYVKAFEEKHGVTVTLTPVQSQQILITAK